MGSHQLLFFATILLATGCSLAFLSFRSRRTQRSPLHCSCHQGVRHIKTLSIAAENMLRTSILKARQVRRRAVDWLALAGKVSTDGARTDVNRLRDLYDEINAAAKAYEGEPAPIDFAQYRKDISASSVVDEFEVSTPVFFFVDDP